VLIQINHPFNNEYQLLPYIQIETVWMR